MNTKELLELKRLLDEGVISQEEFNKKKEKYLKDNDKRKKAKNIGLVVGIFFVFLLCISIITSNVNNNNMNNEEQSVTTVDDKIPAAFKKEFPISINGKIYDNIINVPELSITVTNNLSKNISAIKFYFSPKDVYGEEVNGIFVTNELYTDDVIYAGNTATKSWQLMDSSIKSGEIYVYSIYFDDGTEWGDKDAAVSDIKQYGFKLQVKY